MKCNVSKREFIKKCAHIINTSKKKKSWIIGAQKAKTGNLTVITTIVRCHKLFDGFGFAFFV